ncbi:hypothetical protein FRB99_000828 [Tulasnella sp. 403]|nr:hypothetical protein FRB99_000828 [Tulasnella sp. 403]
MVAWKPARRLKRLVKRCKDGRPRRSTVIDTLHTVLKILDEIDLPIVAPAIGILSEILSMMKDVSDGDEACLQLVSLIHDHTKIISGFLETMKEDYVRHSDEPQAKMAREAVAAFQTALEDAKRFIRSYRKGNWLSRLTRVGEIEEHSEDVDSGQEQFKRVIRAITRINVDAIRKLRFLPQVAGAKQLDNSAIRIVNRPMSRGGREDFWEDVAEAQIEGQVRLVKVYNTTACGMKTFLRELRHMAENRASNLPLIYGFSAATNAPFVVLSSSVVTGFFEYLIAQTMSDKSRALLTAWSMLIDMTDAASFLYDSNPATCAMSLQSAAGNAVVDESGKVLIACPSDATVAIQSGRPPNPSLRAVRFWLHHLKWPITRPLRVLGLALYDNAERILASKSVVPKSAEEAERLLHLWWSPSYKHRYMPWHGGLYDNPASGDFGVLEGPDLTTFRKLGNISSELGGVKVTVTSPSPESNLFPGIPCPGVYRFTIPARHKQDESYRCPYWSIRMQWKCELVDKHLEWDFLLRNAKRLAHQYQVAPHAIVLVTETGSSLHFPESLRTIVDTAKVASHCNIHLDHYGRLSHHYWSHDDRLLSTEESSRQASAMAHLGFYYPELEYHGVHLSRCLQVEEADLSPY